MSKIKHLRKLSQTAEDMHHEEPPNEANMNGLTREEVDAKLNVQDAVAEGRFNLMDERISNSIKALNDGLAELKSDFKSQSEKMRDDNKNLRWWMFGTGLSVVIGIAAFNATVLGNMIASFDSGRETGASIEKATAKLESLAIDIEKQYRKNPEQQPGPQNKPTEPVQPTEQK